MYLFIPFKQFVSLTCSYLLVDMFVLTLLAFLLHGSGGQAIRLAFFERQSACAHISFGIAIGPSALRVTTTGFYNIKTK